MVAANIRHQVREYAKRAPQEAISADAILAHLENFVPASCKRAAVRPCSSDLFAYIPAHHSYPWSSQYPPFPSPMFAKLSTTSIAMTYFAIL